MKLALNRKSEDALRTLASEIPRAMADITADTARLLSTFQSVSDTLGVHEPEFYSLLLSVKRAQETSAEAIEAIPAMLLATADRIDDYVRTRVPYTPGNPASPTASLQRDSVAQRTVFELSALKDSLELTAGDTSLDQRGGTYRDVKKAVSSTLYEVHHIPPQSLFTDAFQDLPAIALLKEDHARTSSFRGKMNKTYRPCFPGSAAYPKHREGLTGLIDRGLFAEAVRNEIYEIREAFGTKYDGAIAQYLDALTAYIDSNGVPELKE